MTFMLCLTIVCFILALYKPHRYEWSLQGCLWFALWLNTSFFGRNDSELYFIRAVLTTLACAALMKRNSDLSVYQAVILLFILLAYGVLALDIAQGDRVLIYDHYEVVIYVLVTCQLFGVYPTIRSGYSDWVANRKYKLDYFQMGKR